MIGGVCSAGPDANIGEERLLRPIRWRGKLYASRVSVTLALTVAVAAVTAACASASSPRAKHTGHKTVKILVIGDANTHIPGIPPLPFQNTMTAATRGFNARNKSTTINATFCDSQLNNNDALACA